MPGDGDVLAPGGMGFAAFGVLVASPDACAVAADVPATVVVVAGVVVSDPQPDNAAVAASATIEIDRGRTARRM
ncbi:hypothetical protein B7C42_08299 [Nocardia cerradoensis]|uniref:Uncharacterized protein n=1 Tax=Nocardia cerradoensis TaxID=85688 RepID=A0A231GSN5_9NOCA|nr:hypothetical protein B7C42_08299 [Nocardia cerradoensis]